jgi:predicted nucleic acid-binding protein
MRIIISDTSCLIDLRKAALLAAFLRLPFEILIPNTLFEDELLSFMADEKRTLILDGLKVVDLPGAQVSRARDVVRARPRLSIHEGFAFALAETHSGCILLTGDSELRSLAESSRIEVHGVLWVCDQLFEGKLSTAEQLHAALSKLAAEPAVRLSKRELAGYIRRYQTLK